MDLRAMHTEQLGQHQPQAERVVQRGAVQVLRGEAWCQGSQGLHVRSPTSLCSTRLDVLIALVFFRTAPSPTPDAISLGTNT